MSIQEGGIKAEAEVFGSRMEFLFRGLLYKNSLSSVSLEMKGIKIIF